MDSCRRRPCTTWPWAWTAAAALLSAVAAPIPAQQVARPTDPDATASARVVVAVQPVGRISYDGLTLPLTSPDGRFIAAQTTAGTRPPSWEALLGVSEGGGPVPPPAGVRLAVHAIELPEPGPAAAKPGSPRPAPRLRAIEPGAALPAGLLLGRSCDSRGFLVESPRDGGERWIGRVAWLSQKVDWIAVKPGAVLAHACDAPMGSPAGLAYVERPVNGAAGFSRLVVRAGAGDAARDQAVVDAAADESLAYPVFSADGRTLGVLAMQSGKLRWLAFEIAREDSGGLALRALGRMDLGDLAAGGPGGPVAAMHHAYACVAAMQSPPVVTGEGATVLHRGLCVFSPRDAAPLWWDPRSDHVLTAAKGTFVAIPFEQGGGWGVLVAGNTEVGYQPLRSGRDGGGPSFGREVQVVAGRHIPRATTRSVPVSGDRADGAPGQAERLTILLAAPKSGDDRSLDVLLIAPARAE